MTDQRLDTRYRVAVKESEHALPLYAVRIGSELSWDAKPGPAISEADKDAAIAEATAAGMSYDLIACTADAWTRVGGTVALVRIPKIAPGMGLR